MRLDTKRLIISLLVIIGIQVAAQYLLAAFGLSGILYIVVYSLIIAFIFGLINYPRSISEAFKDPYFYRYVCIIFIILFVINYFL